MPRAVLALSLDQWLLMLDDGVRCDFIMRPTSCCAISLR